MPNANLRQGLPQGPVLYHAMYSSALDLDVNVGIDYLMMAMVGGATDVAGGNVIVKVPSGSPSLANPAPPSL